MALVIARIGRTASRIRWRGTTSGGSGGTVAISQATLVVTETVAGPLREALRAPAEPNDGGWDPGLRNDMALKLTSHGITTALPMAAGDDNAIDFSIAGPNNVLNFSMGTDVTEAIFELEAVHTMIQ